ncbi:amino acid/polyamine transporter I [Cryomyces antarcticus]|uniref:Amino acid permease/ SLC12A domain-containing protein n=1 Tax=Cryomyces antarcticus TaxID=329879 RepID=A0ABR0M1T2_9PEZI|nr:hypothetical protein LTR39_000129 [Cryomyces antarcticus]KAK5257565.1 hypothetical protein LTR16_000250 [Cryomyces antarcticus]
MSDEKIDVDIPAYDNKGLPPPSVVEDGPIEGEVINVSGHKQELDRNFGFWSICAIGVVSDNAWAAGGGALIIAFYNGGGPGVIFELIAVTFFYVFIGASLAELASSIPSSANVYHWALVTAGPKYGRVCSWYAGWWNCLAWIFGTASSILWAANTIIAMYSLYHPDYTPQRWQIFVVFLIVCWMDASVVMFGQRIPPKLATLACCVCIGGVFITIMVCAIMPATTGQGYASNSFVWTEWNNQTGYTSDGFVFLAGMLNGAFAIGTPDGVCHLCEEIPEPKKNIPKGIAAQLTIGFITTLCFYIAILYSITSFTDVTSTPIVSLPLAAVYQQATRSRAGTTGLLFVFLLDTVVTIPDAYLTAGRMLWALARDQATPFSATLARVHPTHRNPFAAQLACGGIITLLGCIYIASAAAFGAFVGAFAIFTTLSYLAALLPHLLTRRRHLRPGPFWMPARVAYPVLGVASAYIVVFNVVYCFPFALPASPANMNYSALMVGGITVLLTAGYVWKRTRGYVGPAPKLDAEDGVAVAAVRVVGKRGKAA